MSLEWNHSTVYQIKGKSEDNGGRNTITSIGAMVTLKELLTSRMIRDIVEQLES